MHWGSPYWIPPCIGAVLSLFLLGYLWRRRTVQGAVALLLLTAAVMVWAAGYTGELLVSARGTKLLFAQLNWVGIAFMATLWLVFALILTGQRRWLTRARVVGLSVAPVLAVVLAWTNGWHGLLWSKVDLVTSGPLPLLRFEYSLGYWLFYGYSYLLVAAGMVLMVRSAATRRGLLRRQAVVFLAFGVVPALGNLVYNFGFSPVAHLDLTPVLFSLSTGLCTWGLIAYGIAGIGPIARATLFASMADPVVAVDLDDRVVDLNPAAERIFGRKASDVIGEALQPLIAAIDPSVDLTRSGESSVSELNRGGDDDAVYDLRISELAVRPARPVGRLLVFRDVTQRKVAEREREKLIEDLQAALAQVKTLSGILPICANCKKIRDEKDQWKPLDRYVRDHSDASFSHGICPECSEELYGEYLK